MEIRDRFPLATAKASFDVERENVSAPAVFLGSFRVPNTLVHLLHFVQQPDIMSPGQLCNKLLHYFLVRPSLGKGSHILQVTDGEIPPSQGSFSLGHGPDSR